MLRPAQLFVEFTGYPIDIAPYFGITCPESFCILRYALPRMGELVQPVPKEQPPRKLSGKRTVFGTHTLESVAHAAAEGITISGKRTEGASNPAIW